MMRRRRRRRVDDEEEEEVEEEEGFKSLSYVLSVHFIPFIPFLPFPFLSSRSGYTIPCHTTQYHSQVISARQLHFYTTT